MTDKLINKPIYSVLVSRQSDGGGEWIDPEFVGLFRTYDSAEEYGEYWSMNHGGFSVGIYECRHVGNVRAFVKKEAEKFKNE